MATKADVKITPSKGFVRWLDDQNLSLGFTTGPKGSIYFVGINTQKHLTVFDRPCPGAKYLCPLKSGQSYYLNTSDRIARFENAVTAFGLQGDYDGIFLPQMSYITGNIDIHDMGLDIDDRPIFINTLFNCIASVSETHSFIPLWKPEFISVLQPEDRCHLTGMAIQHGVPLYVTAMADTNEKDAWQRKARDGGIIIHVGRNKIMTYNLSHPNSPRMHAGELWLNNAGRGEFGRVDLKTNQFYPICFCPGYLRGLCFSGKYAIVSISVPRKNNFYKDLHLMDILHKKLKAHAKCAILVIDIKKKEIVHSLIFNQEVKEIYDIMTVENVRNPMTIGFKKNDIKRVISIGQMTQIKK